MTEVRRPPSQPATANGRLRAKEWTVETDKRWEKALSGVDLSNHMFQRVSAVSLRFADVDFRYCVFDGCYLRNCSFDSCDFTGCRFIRTSFPGSTFSSCTFDYADFERTLIASAVLDDCCPSHENVRQRFARSLRMNFQSLGDSGAVNKAIVVELEATRVHLHKSWQSHEAYYRGKYRGGDRVRAFLAWTKFRTADLIWGHGESLLRMSWTVVVLLCLLAVLDTVFYRNPMLVSDYIRAMGDSPQVFLGTKVPNYAGWALTLIALTRYVVLGLFLSIVIRRYALR